MINRLYDWAESFRTPFPDDLPEKPPATLSGFIAHYALPFWPLLLGAGILSTIIALLEIYLFSFVGDLVDWITHSSVQSFWTDRWPEFTVFLVIVLFVLPGLRLLFEAAVNQGMLGNFAMRTRWQAHRYLLRQSVEFFQNDFAGRVAAKMMQTSLGVRVTVVKLIEVMLYVAVYFIGPDDRSQISSRSALFIETQLAAQSLEFIGCRAFKRP